MFSHFCAFKDVKSDFRAVFVFPHEAETKESSIFQFYQCANQSAIQSASSLLCAERWSTWKHTQKKESLQSFNCFCSKCLNIISGTVAKICLLQADLLTTSLLHAIPADFFFFGFYQHQSIAVSASWTETAELVLAERVYVYEGERDREEERESGRLGLRPGPWHICVDKHILAHLFLRMQWRSSRRRGVAEDTSHWRTDILLHCGCWVALGEVGGRCTRVSETLPAPHFPQDGTVLGRHCLYLLDTIWALWVSLALDVWHLEFYPVYS